ncbi:MAG: hypothetical protein K8L99_26050 [Anaerolineae bacterium]|nr:hypothetical protein [Anaerolineae bacterium]
MSNYYQLSQEYELKKAHFAAAAAQWQLAKLAKANQPVYRVRLLRQLGRRLVTFGTAIQGMDRPEPCLQIQPEPPLC